MGANVVIVAAAVLVLMTVQTSGQPTWGCSGPKTEEKCVCNVNPVIHVHNDRDKQEESDEKGTTQVHLAQLQKVVDSLLTNCTEQDTRLAELQEQVENLTAELVLIKQGYEKPACLSGSVKFQDRCFSFSTDQKTYTDARSACQAAGGHLAMPKDQATNNFLLNQLTRYPSDSNVWFGLTDLAHERIWVWEDGTPLTDWNDWYPGQPDDFNSSEDCGEWFEISNHWNDRACTVSQYYVCEVGAVVP